MYKFNQMLVRYRGKIDESFQFARGKHKLVNKYKIEKGIRKI